MDHPLFEIVEPLGKYTNIQASREWDYLRDVAEILGSHAQLMERPINCF